MAQELGLGHVALPRPLALGAGQPVGAEAGPGAHGVGPHLVPVALGLGLVVSVGLQVLQEVALQLDLVVEAVPPAMHPTLTMFAKKSGTKVHSLGAAVGRRWRLSPKLSAGLGGQPFLHPSLGDVLSVHLGVLILTTTP